MRSEVTHSFPKVAAIFDGLSDVQLPLEGTPKEVEAAAEEVAQEMAAAFDLQVEEVKYVVQQVKSGVERAMMRIMVEETPPLFQLMAPTMRLFLVGLTIGKALSTETKETKA